jgi:hypothetical protein
LGTLLAALRGRSLPILVSDYEDANPHTPAENAGLGPEKSEDEMNSSAYHQPISWNTLEIVSRQVAADKFNRLYNQARVANLWNHLAGKPNTLLPFEPVRSQLNGVTGIDRGVTEIPVESIAGSVNRSAEYDRQFRPLNPALKNRWINVHILSEYLGWEPIVVHKIGEVYFVEDGHHRVSVARYSGMDYIEAQVYEYQLPAESGRKRRNRLLRPIRAFGGA